MNKLAIEGGKPIRTQPVPAWPVFEKDEVEAVNAVLHSGKVNQWTGDKVVSFQKAYTEFLGSGHVIALANGSVAIELALLAFNIGQGDEVIVTPRSFMASATSVNQVGATPVFADIDYDTQNVKAETIAKRITNKTKAIIVVHLCGQPCDMQPIMELAEKHDLYVIEDCAQAHGAEINGQPVGTFGHAGTFSFCQDKIMSTGGEGGLTVFKDKAHWNWAWSFKDHGKDYDTVFKQDHPPGFRWLHKTIGTNWRMTEMQAAIGICQLGKLPNWQRRREDNAMFIRDGLKEVKGLIFPPLIEKYKHAFYRVPFTIVADVLRSDWDRTRILAAINAEGIACQVGSSPGIFFEGAYSDYQDDRDACPVAVELGEKSLALLAHHTIDREYLDDTIAAVKKVMSHATIK